MILSDVFSIAEAIKPILKQAMVNHKAARWARDATPQFGPDPASYAGTFALPDSFGIPAEYRMFQGKMAIPVLATGQWIAPEEC